MIKSDWVKLPTQWILNGGLRNFQWGDTGATDIVALMVLIALVHHADSQSGISKLTYDEISDIIGHSRTKVSHALDKLISLEIISKKAERSYYIVNQYDPSKGWAKLPAQKMYISGKIVLFNDFSLRKKTELDALKIFLLAAARRDNQKNLAFMTYSQISEWSGVTRNRIKSALALLASIQIVYTEILIRQSDDGIVNSYRLPMLSPYHHMGTTGRHQISQGES